MKRVGRLTDQALICIALAVFALFAIMMQCACSSTATLPADRAAFYKEEALRIFEAQSKLDEEVYKNATVEQRVAKARLLGETMAFWRALLSEIKVSDYNIADILNLITRITTWAGV